MVNLGDSLKPFRSSLDASILHVDFETKPDKMKMDNDYVLVADCNVISVDIPDMLLI